MKSRPRVFPGLLSFVFAVVGAASLQAVPRNPPPVFESDYTLPAAETPMPCPSLAGEHLVAVGLYGLFLVLAVGAVYYRRSRTMLVLLAVASVALLGFVLQGCPCPVGMFQNIADAFVQPTPRITWTVIVLFTLPLLVALFFGRVFCSSVCPLGAVQELTLLKPVRLGEGLEQGLGLFRYVWLGLGVFFVVTGLGYLVCRFDPYVGLFRFGGLYPVLIFSGVVIAAGFFIGRPFCRFFCPYGALLGLCAVVSMKRVSVTPNQCTKCRLCEEICPYNAIRRPTVQPTVAQRTRGPRRLLGAVVLWPVLVVLFAFVGREAAPKLAAWHFDVRTAELLYAEERKLVDAYGSFTETRTLIQTGRPYGEMYQKASETLERFRSAGAWLGVWIGAVVGLKLIRLAVRRRREEYEVDPARCVACGRCFWYCPNQGGTRLLLTAASPAVNRDP